MAKRHWKHNFASAHDFPKFVKAGAAMEHELRKVGTSSCGAVDRVDNKPTTPAAQLKL